MSAAERAIATNVNDIGNNNIAHTIAYIAIPEAAHIDGRPLRACLRAGPRRRPRRRRCRRCRLSPRSALVHQ